MTGRAPKRGRDARLGEAACGSVLLHGVAIGALFWHAPRASPAPDATIQIEYVSQAAATRGAASPAAPAATAPPLARPDGDIPAAQTAARSQAASAGRPAADPGTADADRDALTVTGDDVVSPGPDAAYRNLPPRYPREAVRRHEQGTVQVAIHITPDGLADDVQTLISSGFPSLDDAVREAVLKWHFTPALRDGVAIASIYKLQLNFRTQDGQ